MGFVNVAATPPDPFHLYLFRTCGGEFVVRGGPLELFATDVTDVCDDCGDCPAYPRR